MMTVSGQPLAPGSKDSGSVIETMIPRMITTLFRRRVSWLASVPTSGSNSGPIMSVMPQGQPVPPSPSPASQGQSPSIGSSPATMALPNKGHEAAGLARLGVVVKLLADIVPMLPPNTEPGKDVLQCLQRLSKHIQPGAVSPGVEQASMARLAAQQRQMGPQIAQMRAQNAQQPPSPPDAGGAPEAG